MGNIIELNKLIEELSEEICAFAKPLILDKDHKESIRQILSSETDLRLGVEMIMEADTQELLIQNIQLTKEEAQIILYTLNKFKEDDEVVSMKEKTNKIINIIETCLEN